MSHLAVSNQFRLY